LINKIFGRSKITGDINDIQVNVDSDMEPFIYRKEEFMDYFELKRDPEFMTFAWNYISRHYKLKDHYFLNSISSVIVSWNTNKKHKYQEVLEIAKRLKNDALNEAERNSQKNYLLIPKWGNLAWSQLIQWVINPNNQNDWNKLFLALTFTKDLNGSLIPHQKGTIVSIDVLTAPLLNLLNNYILEAIDTEPDELNEIFDKKVLPCLMFFIKDKSPLEMPVLIAGHLNYEKSKLHTFDQIKFLMAHEIGHYFLEHPVNKKTELHELQADIYGISLLKTVVHNYLLLEKGKDMYTTKSIPIFMGSVELLFHYFALKEAIFNRLDNKSQYLHPPAYKRFLNIQSFNTGYIEFDSTFLLKVKKIIERWLNVIKNTPISELN
jgi:hypothetical protein